MLSYFKDIEEQGTEKLNEAKLIIVGEPEAGKTTLMETLIDPDYELPEVSESTLGIEVREGWEFPHPNPEQAGETFTANIWDFGGQQIQYMTHQFFLTPSAGYVLLSANDRKEPTNFPYWFKIIHLLGEEHGRYSPVLVVLNEKDDKFINKFNFDLTFYQDRYPELQIEICEVNLAKRDGRFQAMRETVQRQLSQLSHVTDDRPARWNDIRNDLRELAKNKDYINFSQYAEVCHKNSVKEEVSQRVLSGYLHRLGSLLHFSDDPSLRDFIILKPQCAVDAVYSVLVDKEVSDSNGRFTQEKLDAIWKDYIISERGHLLNLMKQENFEICYELECDNHGKPKTYIAPQLLNSQQPEFQWDDTDSLKFRFQYTFMPEGIITR
ncbi:MAG: COR domain-containing protein [Thiotrichaceae bacterium]